MVACNSSKHYVKTIDTDMCCGIHFKGFCMRCFLVQGISLFGSDNCPQSNFNVVKHKILSVSVFLVVFFEV